MLVFATDLRGYRAASKSCGFNWFNEAAGLPFIQNFFD